MMRIHPVVIRPAKRSGFQLFYRGQPIGYASTKLQALRLAMMLMLERHADFGTAQA